MHLLQLLFCDVGDCMIKVVELTEAREDLTDGRQNWGPYLTTVKKNWLDKGVE